MPEDDSDGSLAGRIRKTRRQVLTGLGGLGAAGVAAGKLSDEDDDPAIQSGGLAAKLGKQYYRDNYISSDPSTFDPSVMQAGEQYWLSDGEIGVYDGSQTQQYPLGTSSKPIPDIQASNMGVGSVKANDLSVNNVGASVYLGARQSISGSTETKIAFDTENADDESEWDTTNNKFVAEDDGVYVVTASILWAATINDGTRTSIRIRQAGSLTRQSDAHTGISNYVSTEISAMLRLSAGDSVEIYAWQDSSETVDLLSGNKYSYADISQVG